VVEPTGGGTGGPVPAGTGPAADRPGNDDAVVLSAVVVTWNSANVVGECLRSLAAHPPAVRWEVIVVDNASSDGTVDVVRSAAPGATVIRNSSNRGLAAANNQGIIAAAGRELLICNPDVIFQPGAVEAMRAVLGRHDRAAWVVPRLLYEDGRTQTSAGDLPSLSEALTGRQRGRRTRAGAPEGFWWDGWAHDEERVIGRGHEAAYLVDRNVVVEVGPQDERYVLDWEGFDWTERFRRAGWEIWLAPEARVIHLGGASIRQVPARWIRSQHRGMYRYFSARRPVWWRPVLAVAFASRAAVKLAVTLGGLPMYEWAHRDRKDQPSRS
jgi:N-acetylglucosaminyl-diphospho-decaprenol L-rhamnosyltransferase